MANEFKVKNGLIVDGLTLSNSLSTGKLTVSGTISSNNVITALGGSSTQWNTVTNKINSSTAYSAFVELTGDIMTGGLIVPSLTAGTGGSVILYVDDNPRVGINTVTPNKALTVVGDISSNNIIYSKCGDSDKWCSVYNQVKSLSSSWDGDFCNETVNLRTVSGCWDNDLSASFINVSAYDVNFSNNVTILSTLDVGTGSIILFVGNKVGINTTNPNEMLTVNGNISSNNVVYSKCGNSGDWCSVYNQVKNLSSSWDGDFCDETVNLRTVSGCWDNDLSSSFINISAYNVNFSNNVTILSGLNVYQLISANRISSPSISADNLYVGNNSIHFYNGTIISSPTANEVNIANNLTVTNSISSPSISADNLYVGNSSIHFYNGAEISSFPLEDTFYNETWVETASSKPWTDVAMSSDGQRQTAVVNGGYIYTSVDYGLTWVETASSKNWASIAMSSDGQRQTAVVDDGITGGRIYTSVDYGVTWNQVASETVDKGWLSVDMSSDGQYQLAGTWYGVNDFDPISGLYLSTDSGVTWTEIAVFSLAERAWVSVTMSSNGQYQYAIDQGTNKIHFSNDFGSNWSDISPGGLEPGEIFLTITTTPDSSYILVGTSHRIFTSDNYGSSWSSNNFITNKSYKSIAVSSDRKHISVLTNDGVYITNTYGKEYYWKKVSNPSQGTINRIAMSDDGRYQSIASSTYIYYSIPKTHITPVLKLSEPIINQTYGDYTPFEYTNAQKNKSHLNYIGNRYVTSLGNEVRVFNYSSNAKWNQVGSTITLTGISDIKISGNGNRVLIRENVNVTVYEMQGIYNTWTAIASTTLSGNPSVPWDVNSTSEMAINESGNIFAVADYWNYTPSVTPVESGKIQVFQLSGNPLQFVQLGSDIQGQIERGSLGRSISMNLTGNVIIASEPSYYISPETPCKMYQLSGDPLDWVELTSFTNHPTISAISPVNVSINPAGDTVCLSRYNWNSPFNYSKYEGWARVYKNINSSWVQIGDEITGENFDLLRDFDPNFNGTGLLTSEVFQYTLFGFNNAINYDGNSILVGFQVFSDLYSVSYLNRLALFDYKNSKWELNSIINTPEIDFSNHSQPQLAKINNYENIISKSGSIYTNSSKKLANLPTQRILEYNSYVTSNFVNVAGDTMTGGLSSPSISADNLYVGNNSIHFYNGSIISSPNVNEFNLGNVLTISDTLSSISCTNITADNLTVAGTISSNNVITALGGSSTQWNTVTNKINSSTAYSAFVELTGDTMTGGLNVPSLTAGTGGSVVLYVDDNPRVGINTVTPNKALTVVGDISSTLGFSTSGTISAPEIQILDSSKGFIMYSPDNSAWRVTITNSGVLSSVLI